LSDDLYREHILDHYKHPRRSGTLENPDARGEGINPLCGDEITITLAYDGDTISDVRFVGRGCAISQASASMLMEKIVGRSASAVAEMPKEDLLDELGIPLGPVRLKCALLGLSTLKVALHKSKGTPLPDEWGADPDLDLK
jgi:nitrogen fixation NifU-like protein